jgi:hypothetical protein
VNEAEIELSFRAQLQPGERCEIGVDQVLVGRGCRSIGGSRARSPPARRHRSRSARRSKDAGIMVEIVNAISAGVQRSIQFFLSSLRDD